MRKVLFALWLCCVPVALSQVGSRFDSAVLTSANNSPFGAQAQVYTVPFAYIKVCAYPATGNPCTNVVNVYSDPGLTSPITQPFQADNHGRFGFWAAPGEYSYNVQSTGGTNYGQFTITLAGTGGGSATFPSNPGLVYSLNTSTARNAAVADVVSLWTTCTGTMNLRADGTCANASGALSLTTTGTSGLATLASNVLNIPNYTLTTAGVTALGALTNDTSGSAAKIGGVAVSGVPGTGQVPVALSSTTASWQTLAGVPGGSNMQMQFNNSGAFGGSNLTWDGTTLGMATGKQFFGNGTHDVGTIYDYEFTNAGTTLAGGTFENAQEITYRPNFTADVSTTASITAFLANTNATSSHQLGKLVGFGGGTNMLGSGSFNEARGMDSSAAMIGNGSGNGLFGTDTSVGNFGTGTIAWAAGATIQAGVNSGGGSITQLDGLYIYPQLVGVTSHNIFSAGATTSNVFEGSFTVGGNVGMATGKVLSWNSDTGLSRDAAGAVDVGNGTAGNFSGQLKAGDVDIFAPASGLSSAGAFGLRTLGTAISSQNQSAPSAVFFGSYWNGSAAVGDTWTLAPLLGSGTNPTSQLAINHAGGNTGVASVGLPMTSPTATFSAAGTALPSCASGLNGFEAIVTDATAPTYMGAYTSGGAITAKVLCSFNGTTYSWVTH